MELERLQARLTPRSPWQAMDLGTRMFRAWWRPLLGTWLAFTALPFFLIHAWLGDEGVFWAVLAFWWLKPLWEKPLLAFCGRALFGERPGPLTLMREFPGYGFKGLFGLLTWRRLSPARSFNLPVFQLEGGKGDALKRRLSVLHRPPSNGSGSLTVLMLHVEQGLAFGMMMLLYFLAPWQFNLELNEWIMSQQATHNWLQSLSWYLVLTITEPLYVTTGFALYLNRRSWLEGWDLELGLRRIGERRRARGLAGMAAAVLLALPLLTPVSAEAKPPADEQAQAIEILAGPDFMPLEERLRWRERAWIRDESDKSNWLQELLEDWFGDAFAPPGDEPPNLQWLPRAVQGALWGMVAALVLWLLWHYRAWLRWPAGGGRRRPAPATHVAGLDIRPESLPEDIPAAVRAQARAGETRAALALLYRASLSRLVHGRELPVHPGTTENECLELLRRQRPEESLLTFMGRLTRLWTAIAWAHRSVDRNDVEACLADWPTLFDEAEGGHA